MDIKFIKNDHLKAKPDFNNVGFGKYFTDYMFMVDWYSDKGFCDAKIMPYGPIEFDPAALVLHYAQETFEGLKAYKTSDGRVLLFRPDMNAKRFQSSNERLCMPKVDVTDFIEAIAKLVSIEREWIPSSRGSSLYIRPFMFAYEAKLGVHAANHYKFMIVCSPVNNYYKEGLKPVKIYVEDSLVRTVVGGTGFTKCGGNYAASILAQAKAEALGFSQVLWLDGVNHKYVEEVGTMNVMFVINDTIYTSPLNGSILPGVTRDSIITILKDKGYKVVERALAIDELIESAKNGELTEAFGTGTAAVISPIGTLKYKDDVFFNNENIGPISQMLYDTLIDIQRGDIEDKFNWTYEVK